MNPYDQQEYTIRCEWGAQGVATLAPISDVVIIVDVLSFSTAVDIAVGRGATIYPYAMRDESATTFAESIGAMVSTMRGESGTYSLSPTSLLHIPADTKLVLPSPNGATLSLGTGNILTVAGCIRNAEAVAIAAQQRGSTIAVIPAGERWRTDGSLRPSFEDWVGAGAIISHLQGTLSPEAESAVALFRAMQPQLAGALARCASGKELIAKGFAEDVEIASTYNISTTVPFLVEGRYQALR